MFDFNGTFFYSKIIHIENKLQSEFKIYPNPTSNYFSIENNSDKSAIEMLDLAGKILKKLSYKSDNQYDISDLAKGICLVKVKIGGKIVTSKIAIN